jgi:hypothetical protein
MKKQDLIKQLQDKYFRLCLIEEIGKSFELSRQINDLEEKIRNLLKNKK